MLSKIKTLLVEEDLFACNFMSLLLTRDWRTQVVRSTANKRGIYQILGELPLDIIIWGNSCGNETEQNDLKQLFTHLKAITHPPLMLYVGTTPQIATVSRLLQEPQCRGYFLRREIVYSIATAIKLAYDGYWVLSPMVDNFYNGPYLLQSVIMADKYQQLMGQCSVREQQVLRLSVLFHLSHRDIAEEMGIGEIESRKLLRRAYKRLDEIGAFDDIDYTPFHSGFQKASKPNLAFYGLTGASVHFHHTHKLLV